MAGARVGCAGLVLAVAFAAGCDRHPDVIVESRTLPTPTPTATPTPAPTTTTPTTPAPSVLADLVWSANDAYDIELPGDLDDDGRPDLLLSRMASVDVIADPLAGTPPSPVAVGFEVASPPVAAAGDVDQDGRADWWALDTEGRAWLVSGVGPATLGDADVGFVRLAWYWPPLSFVADDIDGDSVSELVATDHEQLAVFGDPPAPGGVRTVTIEDDVLGYPYGPKCGLVGDLDGDGVSDVAAWIGWTLDAEDWYSGTPDGDVYVFTGLADVTGTVHLDDADVRLLGAAVHSEAMDWDGDGATDLALFGDTTGYERYAPVLPVVRIVTGPIPDGLDPTVDAAATLLVDFAEGPGSPVVGEHIHLPGPGTPGDLDGDGADELVVSQGSTWVVRGGTGGVSYASDALLLTVSQPALVAQGRSDLDGDGRDDLVLSVQPITGPGGYVGVWLGSAL